MERVPADRAGLGVFSLADPRPDEGRLGIGLERPVGRLQTGSLGGGPREAVLEAGRRAHQDQWPAHPLVEALDQAGSGKSIWSCPREVDLGGQQLVPLVLEAAPLGDVLRQPASLG